jgi:hypothetical protein
MLTPAVCAYPWMILALAPRCIRVYPAHPSGWPRPKMRGVSPATAGVRAKRATGPCVTTVPKSSDARSRRSPRRAQKLSGAIVEAGISTKLAADRPKQSARTQESAVREAIRASRSTA